MMGIPVDGKREDRVGEILMSPSVRARDITVSAVNSPRKQDQADVRPAPEGAIDFSAARHIARSVQELTSAPTNRLVLVQCERVLVRITWTRPARRWAHSGWRTGSWTCRPIRRPTTRTYKLYMLVMRLVRAAEALADALGPAS
ncbi:hypothetical protein GCM10010431_80780 [Streptomyces kunmingensis]